MQSPASSGTSGVKGVGAQLSPVPAVAPLLAFADADDLTFELMRVFEKSEPRFYFRGGWIVFDDGTREEFDLDATADSLLENNTVLTSSLAYPRSLHRRLGLLDRELGGYCDWDFMLRMIAVGVRPKRLPGAGVCYAIHEGNVSAAFDAPERRTYFERFKAKHALEIEIANHLRIHRSLSR